MEKKPFKVDNFGIIFIGIGISGSIMVGRYDRESRNELSKKYFKE